MMNSEEIQKAVRESKLLVVDDDKDIRRLIRLCLESDGYSQLTFAKDGKEAMSFLRSHPCDGVLLDLHMPEVNGEEVLRFIKANEELRDIPILVITSEDSRENRSMALRSGASNLMPKPLDPELLLERIHGLLERQEMFRSMRRFEERMERELENAKALQLGIMPTADELRDIEERYDCGFSAHYQSSSELGGDFWGFQEVDDGRICIYNADFTGHGVAAAMNTFRLHTIISKTPMGVRQTPADYLAFLNDELKRILPVGQFATMICALIDFEEYKLTYARAGSPSPLFGSRDNGLVMEGGGTGLPLGIMQGVEYKNCEYDFPPGSFFFVFSDALFETPLRQGKVLGLEGVTALTQVHKAKGAKRALKGVLTSFYDSAPAQLPDDLTSIWINIH